LSLNDATHVFHKALLAELVSGKHQRLGDTVLDAPPPANKPPESEPSLSSKQRATHARIVGRVRTHSPRMNPAAHADRHGRFGENASRAAKAAHHNATSRV